MTWSICVVVVTVVTSVMAMIITVMSSIVGVMVRSIIRMITAIITTYGIRWRTINRSWSAIGWRTSAIITSVIPRANACGHNWTTDRSAVVGVIVRLAGIE